MYTHWVSAVMFINSHFGAHLLSRDAYAAMKVIRV